MFLWYTFYGPSIVHFDKTNFRNFVMGHWYDYSSTLVGSWSAVGPCHCSVYETITARLAYQAKYATTSTGGFEKLAHGEIATTEGIRLISRCRRTKYHQDDHGRNAQGADAEYKVSCTSCPSNTASETHNFRARVKGQLVNFN